ncbi:MAG: HIT domain-containing protein [Chromatiaceae bacterium]|jgi:diadenosine tetraphosphate (Ap4A) HIT family hydrolase
MDNAIPDSFTLDPQLARDCHLIGDLPLSRVLLLNDCRYPWVVLVPRREGMREIYQLCDDDRRTLLDESCRVGALMMQAFDGEKLNIAALGNLVPQLHLHHVVRHRADPAWPGPVWGHSPAVSYPEDVLQLRTRLLRDGLAL